MNSLEILIAASYFLGVILAVRALWKARTPQGTTAWVIALLALPLLTIPLFIIFGKSRFMGKIGLKRIKDKNALKKLNEIDKFLNDDPTSNPQLKSFDHIAKLSGQPGFTNGNQAHLLIDGKVTYSEMLKVIEEATDYILFQFYIFRMDRVGEAFTDALVKKARQGVRVYFISDKIGTNLSRKVLNKFRDSGVAVKVFYSSRDWESRFQVNFRNHKKLIIIDGKTCITGGLNIGEDYIGRNPQMGFWRDTAIKTQGPSVQVAQMSFIQDWFWASDELIELNWKSEIKEEDSQLMIQHTGPSDPLEAAHLIHLQLINEAKVKLWIATPYFIPSESILNAITLAKMRGVDVRIILPSFSDNPMLFYATQVYIEKLLTQDIPVYLYQKGFMHQKVLMSEKVASIGTLNMDSRSFFLNFELFTISNQNSLISQVEEMLLADMKNSKEVNLEEFNSRSLFKQFLARFFNLFSPIL